MCNNTIPGTVMEYNGRAAVFETFRPMLSAAGGVSLGQICSITSLEPSTVQNWVKRGFVPRPVGKKYGERQLARILLISALRDSMQIERIGELMRLINGDANDESDDIVSEPALYDYFCKCVLESAGGENNEGKIKAVIKDYSGPFGDSKKRLFIALCTMTLAYESARIRKLSEKKFLELKTL